MVSLFVKITLGILACALALFTIVKVKAVEKADPKKPWYKNFTKVGITMVLIAVGALTLGITNEIIEYDLRQKSVKASKVQKAEIEQLQQSLDYANEKIERSQNIATKLVGETAALYQNNQFLLKVLDNSIVRADTAIVGPDIVGASNSSNNIRLLRNTENQIGFPEKGDIIEWDVTCTNGSVPRIEQYEEMCHEPLYGALIAFAYRVDIDEKSGQKTLVGTLSNDSEMVYWPAAYAGGCEEFDNQIRNRQCSIKFTFWRSARHEFIRVREESVAIPRLNLSQSARTACRQYEALYNESCEQALQMLSYR